GEGWGGWGGGGGGGVGGGPAGGPPRAAAGGDGGGPGPASRRRRRHGRPRRRGARAPSPRRSSEPPFHAHTATPALRHPPRGLARREAKHSRPSPDGTGGLAMKRTIHTLGLATMFAGTLALASPASAAFVSLPSSGAQVNDEPVNTIGPDEDAGLVDVAGGTVVAGNKQVPWATFEQKLGSWQEIFVRAFKNGAWVTQGSPAS